MINLPPQSGQRATPNRQQVQDAAASAGLVLPDVAVLALQQGRLIEAIKLIRAANPGLDLARAKAVMERMQAQARSASAGLHVDKEPLAAARASMPLQSRRPPTVEMGDRPGQLRWVLLVAALLAAAVWVGFGSGG